MRMITDAYDHSSRKIATLRIMFSYCSYKCHNVQLSKNNNSIHNPTNRSEELVTFKTQVSHLKSFHKSCDSSVSIALDYGQDNQGSRVQFLAGAGNCTLHHCVQNGSGAHPASYLMGTRGSFPGSKAAQGMKLTTHLHLVLRSRNAWSYTSTTPICLYGVMLS
jgi:hypothetical protein